MTTLFARTALLPEGWAQNVAVHLDQGRIVAVTPDAPPQGQVVDLLLPAPTNLHSHCFQRAMAGLTEKRSAGQDSFWTWRSLMYRFLDRLTPQDVQSIAAMAMMEMAETGFAAVAEFHYLHHGQGGQVYDNIAEMSVQIAAAAAETGLGLTHLPVLYQQGGMDGRALTSGQMRFGNDPDRYAILWQAAAQALRDLPGDTVLGVAPHSLRAVTQAGLVAVAGLAPTAPIHIHVAEQVAEVDEILSHTGARPVAWLLAQHSVDARWCLIHATQMLPAETTALARSGAVAGLCPITEANLGDGLFDALAFAGQGGRSGIGSDSNIRISLSEELRLLEYGQRLAHKGRALLASPEKSTGRMLYEAACQGGAQAAGRQAGAIRVGLWGDLLALDCSGPDMASCSGDSLLDTYIFAGGDRLVSAVWSAGRAVVTGGQHRDRAAITARYAACMARLRGDL